MLKEGFVIYLCIYGELPHKLLGQTHPDVGKPARSQTISWICECLNKGIKTCQSKEDKTTRLKAQITDRNLPCVSNIGNAIPDPDGSQSLSPGEPWHAGLPLAGIQPCTALAFVPREAGRGGRAWVKYNSVASSRNSGGGAERAGSAC